MYRSTLLSVPGEHREIILDDATVEEATHGRDGLLGDVRLCQGIVVGGTSADTVHLLVQLSTVVVAVVIIQRCCL